MLDKNKTVVCCPMCKTYWVAETLDDTHIYTEYGITDISKPISCMTCGATYIPLTQSVTMYDFVADGFTRVKGG